jgi:ParB family chromosome partitioning protein
MAEDATRKRLGRGLAALMGDVGQEQPSPDRNRGSRRVPIEFLRANPHNPRRVFAEEEIGELADSIRQRGIIQPIVVRGVAGATDSFEIIAGERRWRAAQRVGLHKVPIVVLDVSDGEALELAIIENVQRANLNPIEEAMGYQTLAEQYGHNQEGIARIVGKSRSHIANTVRLLKLPDSVKAYINAGQLTAGHARALLAQSDPAAVAREIVEGGLNVRAVERKAQDEARKQGKPVRARQTPVKDADTAAVEKRLSDALGLAVVIEPRGEAGSLTIRYKTLEQLDDVIRRIEQH